MKECEMVSRKDEGTVMQKVKQSQEVLLESLVRLLAKDGQELVGTFNMYCSIERTDCLVAIFTEAPAYCRSDELEFEGWKLLDCSFWAGYDVQEADLDFLLR